MKPSLKNGGLIWITGLSGSGKTTIAKELVKYYQNKAILIDGDEVRKVLDLSSSGYDYKGRKRCLISAKNAFTAKPYTEKAITDFQSTEFIFAPQEDC